MKKITCTLIALFLLLIPTAYTQDEDTGTGPVFLPDFKTPIVLPVPMHTNIFDVIIGPQWNPYVFLVDIDEALPHYKPLKDLHYHPQITVAILNKSLPLNNLIIPDAKGQPQKYDMVKFKSKISYSISILNKTTSKHLNLKPLVDIDEALPHYKIIGYLTDNTNMPKYITLELYDKNNKLTEKLPNFIMLSTTGVLVDIDEALPHY